MLFASHTLQIPKPANFIPYTFQILLICRISRVLHVSRALDSAKLYVAQIQSHKSRRLANFKFYRLHVTRPASDSAPYRASFFLFFFLLFLLRKG